METGEGIPAFQLKVEGRVLEVRGYHLLRGRELICVVRSSQINERKTVFLHESSQRWSSK